MGLQRLLASEARAIPDLVAMWFPKRNRPSLRIAFEVDLGGERLTSVFLPKLARVACEMASSENEGPSAIVVLTSGAKRGALIGELAMSHEVPLVVEHLPQDIGKKGLRALTDVAGAIKTWPSESLAVTSMSHKPSPPQADADSSRLRRK